MRIFTSDNSPNTRAAIPGVSRKFSPTRHTMAFLPSYFTSASLARSAARAGMLSFDTTVRETLTSDVETTRSEEHTSELQSRLHLVCRLLLEKKTKRDIPCRKILLHRSRISARKPHPRPHRS